MRKLFRRIWYFVTWRRRQAELAEEMAFHREMKERELRLEGGDSHEVTLQVRRALGNVALARDEARDEWLWPHLQSLLQDVRFAARVLSKDLRFTVTAVLALALGLAVNTTIFSIFNTAVLRDLPFDQPDRLVSIATRDARGQRGGVSFQDFNDWRGASTTLAGMAAYVGGAVNLSDETDAPERVRNGAFISSNTFALLRVQPILGRDFIAEDDRPGATPVAILGYGIWQRRYGGDRAVIGSTVRVDDVPARVIGIMPAQFGFPLSGDLWLPLASAPAMRAPSRDRRVLQVFGRLAPGTTVDRASAELEALSEQTAGAHPATNKGVMARVEGMNEWIRTMLKPTLFTLMAFVLLVLLIACANVANLLLARSVSRRREIAIRASLGATRWRLVRQMLIECGALALLAGGAGLALSVFGVRYLGRAFGGREMGAPMSTAVMPYWVDLSMNEVVFVFVGGLCLLITILSGLAPALHVASGDANEFLKEGARGGGLGFGARRLTGGFMIVQIALTVVLLAAAVSMMRAFVSLYQADRVVVDTSNLVTARVLLPAPKYATPELRHRFVERLNERLSSSSLFSGMTMTTTLPFANPASTRRVELDGQMLPVEELTSVGYIQVDERYFNVLGLRMARGRALEEADATAGREGVVIDRRLAQMLFQDRDPTGHRIRLIEGDARTATSDLRTIVGVAPAIPHNLGLRGDGPALVFAPLSRFSAPATLSVIVHGRGEMAAVVSQLREEVRAIDSSLPVYYAQTLEDVFVEARSPLRLIGGWFGALAVIAVLLAAVGLFALTGHLVTQRTREIGVRIALGARSAEIVWLVLQRTLVQVAFGAAIGVAGAIGAGRLIQAWIEHADVRSPLTLVYVTLLLAAVAIGATVLPARRAARIDPIAALRYE